MIITVGIDLLNPRDEEVPVVLPAGSIFEVPSSLREQNVALIKQYRFVLPPRSQLRVEVDGVCLNRRRDPPLARAGRFTPFRYDSSTLDQDEVWRRVSAPRTEE